MSIRARLAATYGIGLAAVLVLVGVVVWWQMGVALRGSLETTLQTRATGIITSLENAGQSGLQETDRAAPGVFAALFSPTGSTIDQSADTPAGIRPLAGVQSIAGHDYLVAVQTASSGTLVVTGADLRPVTDAQAALARLLAAVGALVGVVSVAVVWILARRALRPIDALIVGAAEIGPDDLARRLPTSARRDEVGRLTLTLNGMLDRIADSVERQRLFVAMASHELRTPLAALRTELELADRDDATPDEYRSAIRDAQADAIRLGGLSTSLLELAASAVDVRALARSRVVLQDLVAGVVRGLDALARQNGSQIVVAAAQASVSVDRVRIEQALANLVTNALVHGGRGGTVEVHATIADGLPARTLTVEVLDRGPGLRGVPADRLFEPFQRDARSEHPGAGLGLATVATAIRAHDGTYGAEDRVGGGARFWFTVPVGASDVAQSP